MTISLLMMLRALLDGCFGAELRTTHDLLAMSWMAEDGWSQNQLGKVWDLVRLSESIAVASSMNFSMILRDCYEMRHVTSGGWEQLWERITVYESRY